MDVAASTSFWLTRLCFQRSLAFIYLIGFLIAVNQGRGLIGERGLLPARNFVKHVGFWDSPSIFWFQTSDTFLMTLGWLGVGLALVALIGLSENYGLWVSMLVWTALWVIYLSFVNVGQTFYGFGWETLLLETGFLAIFMGSADVAPSAIPIWLVRWILFRVMFGAGLIKLRGDPCWRDLTCMIYHYETQPLPNPLSWYFHQLPAMVHRAGVLITHFIELIVPFGLFGPRPLNYIAGLLMIGFQVTLILSGNLSWLNCITLVLCVACFDDAFIAKFLPMAVPATLAASSTHQYMVWGVAFLIVILSIRPVMNLVSPHQAMNRSFDSLHLVNTYGAFGSVTKVRQEILIEGTHDQVITPETKWVAYEFKGKPGDPDRMPPQVTPYHFKIDWQMWFAAMSEYYHHPWIINLMAKLLSGEKQVTKLLGKNPFEEKPPRYVRAEWYEYKFAPPGDMAGSWWRRRRIGPYLPPLSLDDPSLQNILKQQGWESEPAGR